MQKLISVLSLLSITWFSSAQEILEWRGINRTGHYHSENIAKEWGPNGPNLLLKVDSLQMSYSSVQMKDQVLYTTGITDEDEILTAIDMDGNILWNIVYGKAWGKSYPNARCTPTIESNFAYLISGRGHLACVNITDGSLLWSFDGFTKFEGACGTWGVAESPLIVDEKMIYTPCGEKTTMVAVSKKTGETIWMSESIDEESAYVSPVVIERNSTKLIITVTSNYILAFNAADGEIFWKFNYEDVEGGLMGTEINPVTPLVIGNEIFVTSGYNHAGVMLKMADDLRSVELKWVTEDLDVHHGGVVAHDGYIYGASFTGMRKGDWICLDWETGELQYQHEWNTKGSIIIADGMLICYEEKRGNIALVEATPKEFKIKSEFRITEGTGPHWSHPSIFDN